MKSPTRALVSVLIELSATRQVEDTRHNSNVLELVICNGPKLETILDPLNGTKLCADASHAPSLLMWTKLAVPPNELHLATVLACGQSFRWLCKDNIWSMALRGRVYFLKQEPNEILIRSEPESDCADLSDYLNLKVDLQALAREWSRSDAKAEFHLHGVRILRQDPWETLCAFICSSNNNIKRISKMVNSLCTEFGPLVATIDGHKYHDFPEPEAMLHDGVAEKLRELGFGYRAKYIAATAQQVAEKPKGYLDGLRQIEYPAAKQALIEFKGVGPKVADCVCLMALDKNDCVPVDTHIWQVAARDYKLKFQQNAKGYEIVQTHFKELWGEYAGWAQAVVFAQDLKEFNVKVEPVVGDAENGIEGRPKKRVRKVKVETEVVKLKQEENSAQPIKLEEIKVE